MTKKINQLNIVVHTNREGRDTFPVGVFVLKFTQEVQIMNKEVIYTAFRGFLSDDRKIQILMEYCNLVKNNQQENAHSKTNLVIESDDTARATDFAKNIAEMFKAEKMISSYKVVSSSHIEDSLDSLLIVEDIDSSVKWEELKEKVQTLDKIILLCTTKEKSSRYREDANDYFDLFKKKVILTPYTLEDICQGAHFFFETLQKNKELSYDSTFFPALDKYIRTIYLRANFKGEKFVLDLKERVLVKSFETDHPKKLNEMCIPFYREKENREDIEKDIREHFCFCIETDNLLDTVSRNVKAKALHLSTYVPSFNIALHASFFETIEQFSRKYGTLLNTEDFNIISSQNIEVVNPYEFMLIRENLNNKHGIIVLKDLDSLKDAENVNEVVEQIIESVDVANNDIVWVLAKAKEIYDVLEEETKEKLQILFSNNYDLDKHTPGSSKKYIQYIYDSKNQSITDEQMEELSSKVNEASSLIEATELIEKYLVDHLSVSKEDAHKEGAETQKKELTFEDVVSKEQQLAEMVKNIPDNKKEKNVLLLAMSILNDSNLNVSNYVYNEGIRVDGPYVSQLEPVPKVLAELLAKDKKKIDYIYVLNTPETSNNEKDTNSLSHIEKKYTAFEYFKERCSAFVKPENIIDIPLEEQHKEETPSEKRGGLADLKALMNQKEKDERGDKTDVEQALEVFTRYMLTLLAADNKVNMYVDIHGGLRDTFTVIDAVLMLIKEIKNVELKNIFTVARKDQKKNYVVKSVDDKFAIFDFVTGMREFLSFGRSNGLVNFNNTIGKPANRELVTAINNISDSIVLDRMNNFESQLLDLNKLVTSKENNYGYFEIVKELIKDNYKVNIDNKSIDLLTSEGSQNFPAQLQWCVDKNLLQQALVLIEAKSAAVLYNEEILSPDKIKTNKNPKKKAADVMGNWVKFSLCDNGKEWTEVDESGQRLQITAAKAGIYYSVLEEEYFDGISPDNKNIQQIKEEISKKKIDSSASGEKYAQYLGGKDFKPKNPYYASCEENDGKKYNNYYTTLKSIPLSEKLCDNPSFLNEFYPFLYMYKELKQIRNSVAHCDEENRKADLPSNTVKQWIELYIEQFNIVLSKASEINPKQRNSKNTKQGNSRNKKQGNARNKK